MKLPLASSALLLGAATMASYAIAVVDAQTPTLISASAADPVPINYTDPYDGASLMGYLATPPSGAATLGHVVIFPDWDGVNEYEIRRSALFAEMGYATFAADVYGSENYNPSGMDEMGAMSSRYRDDIPLSNARIRRAVELVKGLEGYGDAVNDGVIIAGYCFGGSIVLHYALSGQEGALAAIAYHGGIGSVRKDLNTTIDTSILIFSGGEDFADSTASIMAMEDALDVAGGTWEIDRYSGVLHSFTDFTLEVPIPELAEYNEHVDMRTWESTGRFLEEVFSGEELQADLPDGSMPLWVDEQISYSDPVDGTALNGFVSSPSAIAADEDGNVELLPAVVIVHDASGIDSMEMTRAHMLTQLGYVGFAADIYGSDHGYDLTNRTERFALLGSIRSDVPLFVRRIKAAVTAAKSHPRVDPTKIAAIGYCFGGTGVINYAVTGQDDVRAVVSFHGGLSGVLMDGYQGSIPAIHAKVNIQSGGDDDASSDIEMLETALERGNATWEYARYDGVRHSFTNWNDARGRYDARADVRSWESMRGFLAEAFADEVEDDLDVVTDKPEAPEPTAADAKEPAPAPTPAEEPAEEPPTAAQPTPAAQDDAQDDEPTETPGGEEDDGVAALSGAAGGMANGIGIRVVLPVAAAAAGTLAFIPFF